MPKDIIDGFGRDVQCATSRYFTEETIPQNTGIESPAVETGEGGVFGQNKIIVKAATAVTLADTTTLTVAYQDSADGSTDWQALASSTITMSGATVFDVGEDLIVPYFLPDEARKYTRVALTTTDAAATGTFDAYNSREPFNTL